MMKFVKRDGGRNHGIWEEGELIGWAVFYDEMPSDFSLFDEGDMENEFDAGRDQAIQEGADCGTE
jgi:hypothetical protein